VSSSVTIRRSSWCRRNLVGRQSLINAPDWGGAFNYVAEVVPRDSDHDGVADNVDGCPEQPEDVDGKDDTDGCPD
jgi:hypothetical protein